MGEQEIELEQENVIIQSGGGGAVNSVNGYTGDVVLTTSDLENTSDYQTGSEVEGAISSAVANKQDKLTAGSNVVISNENVISATDTTYTAGTNVQISSGNVISATDTTYNNFTGTDGTSAGAAGLVPAPATTDAGKFLKADGTWDTAGGGSGPTVVQTTGTSTTDVMSQNATTSMVFADPGTGQKVQIGATGVNGAYGVAIGYQSDIVSGARTIALGYRAEVSADGAVAIGAGANASQKGQVSFSSSSTGFGYNNSNYRLLTGLYDPQSAHDAATKGYVDTAVAGAAYNPTISNNTLYL